MRPDGKITTPLVNDIVAVGKTVAALSKDIETALSEYVRSPTVNVIVTRAAGAYAPIKIVGQAATSKVLPFRSGVTILDAVIEASGLSTYTSGNRAQLIRTDNGKVTRKRVRLQDLRTQPAVVARNAQLEQRHLARVGLHAQPEAVRQQHAAASAGPAVRWRRAGRRPCRHVEPGRSRAHAGPPSIWNSCTP